MGLVDFQEEFLITEYAANPLTSFCEIFFFQLKACGISHQLVILL